MIVGIAILSDTDPEVAEVQRELLRKMTSSQRSSLMTALTAAAFGHAKRAIARANPGATQREIDLIFIGAHYGEALAQEVKAYLEDRDACTNP